MVSRSKYSAALEEVNARHCEISEMHREIIAIEDRLSRIEDLLIYSAFAASKVNERLDNTVSRPEFEKVNVAVTFMKAENERIISENERTLSGLEKHLALKNEECSILNTSMQFFDSCIATEINYLVVLVEAIIKTNSVIELQIIDMLAQYKTSIQRLERKTELMSVSILSKCCYLIVRKKLSLFWNEFVRIIWRKVLPEKMLRKVLCQVRLKKLRRELFRWQDWAYLHRRKQIFKYKTRLENTTTWFKARWMGWIIVTKNLSRQKAMMSRRKLRHSTLRLKCCCKTWRNCVLRLRKLNLISHHISSRRESTKLKQTLSQWCSIKERECRLRRYCIDLIRRWQGYGQFLCFSVWRDLVIKSHRLKRATASVGQVSIKCSVSKAWGLWTLKFYVVQRRKHLCARAVVRIQNCLASHIIHKWRMKIEHCVMLRKFLQQVKQKCRMCLLRKTLVCWRTKAAQLNRAESCLKKLQSRFGYWRTCSVFFRWHETRGRLRKVYQIAHYVLSEKKLGLQKHVWLCWEAVICNYKFVKILAKRILDKVLKQSCILALFAWKFSVSVIIRKKILPLKLSMKNSHNFHRNLLLKLSFYAWMHKYLYSNSLSKAARTISKSSSAKKLSRAIRSWVIFSAQSLWQRSIAEKIIKRVQTSNMWIHFSAWAKAVLCFERLQRGVALFQQGLQLSKYTGWGRWTAHAFELYAEIRQSEVLSRIAAYVNRKFRSKRYMQNFVDWRFSAQRGIWRKGMKAEMRVIYTVLKHATAAWKQVVADKERRQVAHRVISCV